MNKNLIIEKIIQEGSGNCFKSRMYLSKCQALGLITVLTKNVLKPYVNYFKQKLGPERDFASNSKSTEDKRSILTYLQIKTFFT